MVSFRLKRLWENGQYLMLEISPSGRKLLVFFNIFLLSVFFYEICQLILTMFGTWDPNYYVVKADHRKTKLFDPTATYLLTISIYSFLSDFSVKIQNFPVSRSRTCLPFLSFLNVLLPLLSSRWVPFFLGFLVLSIHFFVSSYLLFFV